VIVVNRWLHVQERGRVGRSFTPPLRGCPCFCGAHSLAGLVYLGSCLVAFQNYALVGVLLEGLGVLWSGK
jgi:hypothetical protein